MNNMYLWEGAHCCLITLPDVGIVSFLYASDYSTINCFDGSMLGGSQVRDFGTINMIGGVAIYLGAIESGTINIWDKKT